jgi:hypothetical protein
MHDNDFVNELLLRDTDADDPDLPDLMRERLASPDSRHDPRPLGSIHRASAPLSYLLDAACQESTTSALRVLSLEDDPATQEVFSVFFAPDEGFEMTGMSEVATCLEYLRATSEWSDSETSTERLSPLPFEVLVLEVRLIAECVDAIMLRALDPEPQHRYGSAGLLAVALGAALTAG